MPENSCSSSTASSVPLEASGEVSSHELPLTYSNCEGSWLEEEESTLVLTYMSAKRMCNFRLEILSLSDNVMRFRISVVE